MEYAHIEKLSGGVTIKIAYDTDPLNPREEYDNVGTMVCWHRRYTLGDVQPRDTPQMYRQHLAADAVGEARLVAHLDLLDRKAGPLSPTGWFERECAAYIDRILAKHYVILPLYLYDHGGITMSTGRFSCPWDSGQVGFIYVSREKAIEEWGKHWRKPAEKYLRGEVETYDHFLTGQCYGYVIATPDDDHAESCWGFLGCEDECLQEARRVAAYYVNDIAETAAREIEAARPDMYEARA